MGEDNARLYTGGQIRPLRNVCPTDFSISASRVLISFSFLKKINLADAHLSLHSIKCYLVLIIVQ